MAVYLRHPREDLAETHEINVTPFIDVMLVLLIIFMVAAPLATVDIAVDLPRSSAAPQPRPPERVYVTIKADQTLAIGDRPVRLEDLPAALRAAAKDDKDKRIFLRGDRAASYGRIMEVMDALRAGGFLKVALVGAEKGPAK